MSDEPPPVTCLRCEQSAPIYTVPLRLLSPKERAWISLCRDCFVEVTGEQPTAEMGYQRIRQTRRSRRR